MESTNDFSVKCFLGPDKKIWTWDPGPARAAALVPVLGPKSINLSGPRKHLIENSVVDPSQRAGQVMISIGSARKNSQEHDKSVLNVS